MAVSLFCFWIGAVVCGQTLSPMPVRPFGIRIVDDVDGRGVPLVELRTTDHRRFFTDSQGWAAVGDQDLLGSRVFFAIESHGYEFAKDGFGFAGRALDLRPGERVVLKLHRKNIAQRLYRITGSGVYADSLLLGEPIDGRPGLGPTRLNAQVLGSDSVANVILGGQLHWFWGDTVYPKYPLGNFHVPGAVSKWRADGGLDPDLGVDLEYFKDGQGYAKETAHLAGPGPTWLYGLTVLTDQTGREQMLGGYVKIKPPLDVYEKGVVRWIVGEKRFEKVRAFPLDAPLYPTGHTFLLRNEPGNAQDFVYFCQPLPFFRVRGAAEPFADPNAYESFTCQPAHAGLASNQVERKGGEIFYGWKAGAAALDFPTQERLRHKAGLAEDECLVALRNIDDGKRIDVHHGSTYWNAHRQRFVAIFCERGGSSMLGETWYAEADTPVGPWVYARKIVTHQDYSFYNPKQHPYFATNNGRTIYFEGTYTSTFSGAKFPTPKYDYNQLMYRMDLADDRLRLPVPVYSVDGGDRPFATMRNLSAKGGGGVAFFAHDRPGPSTTPVVSVTEGGRPRLKRSESGEPLFFAAPTLGQVFAYTNGALRVSFGRGRLQILSGRPAQSRGVASRRTRLFCVEESAD